MLKSVDDYISETVAMSLYDINAHGGGQFARKQVGILAPSCHKQVTAMPVFSSEV